MRRPGFAALWLASLAAMLRDKGAALLLLIGSLGVSIWEIQISVRALEIHLHDMEK